MMFCFSIYDVLHSVLWCFEVHSMIDCNPFYDRLQPILWCFERLRMMFLLPPSGNFLSNGWKQTKLLVTASSHSGLRVSLKPFTVRHRQSGCCAIYEGFLKKRNGCNMMKYFLDFKDFCQIFVDFRLNLCAFVSLCFIK